MLVFETLQGLKLQTKKPQRTVALLGCPRKIGSMASKWVISPTYKWRIPKNPGPSRSSRMFRAPIPSSE